MKKLISFSMLSIILCGCYSSIKNESSKISDVSLSAKVEETHPKTDLSEIATTKTTPDSLISVFYFDYDGTSLDEVSKKLLNPLANYLKANPLQKIVIVGNSDIRGPHQYNQALGQQRANSVAAYLISQGVSAQQMSVISRGKENPLSLVDSEQAQALNRRVEILFERA